MKCPRYSGGLTVCDHAKRTATPWAGRTAWQIWESPGHGRGMGWNGFCPLDASGCRRPTGLRPGWAFTVNALTQQWGCSCGTGKRLLSSHLEVVGRGGSSGITDSKPIQLLLTSFCESLKYAFKMFENKWFRFWNIHILFENVVPFLKSTFLFLEYAIPVFEIYGFVFGIHYSIWRCFDISGFGFGSHNSVSETRSYVFDILVCSFYNVYHVWQVVFLSNILVIFWNIGVMFRTL